MLLIKCRKIAGHFNHFTMAKQEKIQVRPNQKILKVCKTHKHVRISAIICWEDLIASMILCRFILLVKRKNNLMLMTGCEFQNQKNAEASGRPYKKI